MKKYRISAHAKCILAGEHAVLRGFSALVFPVRCYGLTFDYAETGSTFEVQAEEPYSDVLLSFFRDLLKTALTQLGKEHQDITGQFFITNTIPMGAGLGFSAAFCAAISQWFLYKGWIEAPHLINFARKLENGFHGRSSGLDIVGALASQAIYFEHIDKTYPLALAWQPKLYLSRVNPISGTAKCIEKVDALWRAEPNKAKKIDSIMQESVWMAREALSSDAEAGIHQLKIAINDACRCFRRWGLINSALEEHIRVLKQAGALAAKPTGAGMGGYVLSLWDTDPSRALDFECLSVFSTERG